MQSLIPETVLYNFELIGELQERSLELLEWSNYYATVMIVNFYTGRYYISSPN